MADFDQIYWAHQPPETRALPTFDDETQRSAQAIQLAGQGFIVDVPIMIWLWDPLKCMQLRQSYAYTWVPSALQPPIAVAPGLVVPGQPVYDPNHPPPGSIKVSVDPNDYPPFDPAPVPTPVPVNTDVVGSPILGVPKMFYALGVATTWPDGSIATDARGKFLLHRVLGPMGASVWFEQVG
ncbi:MAG TPA: hypothetical protein VKG25_23500 [Bryobacteraceae bacterium]|nr:hypothetical protein [Bryobacteraceae bacterium]